MSDNLRRYQAIRNALVQAYPAPPTGNLARHLSTLAALISGIVGSKSTQLPTIAAKVPNGTKPASRVKRFARWFDNDHIWEEVYFLPYADLLLRHCALPTLVLVMDGSVAGAVVVGLCGSGCLKGRGPAPGGGGPPGPVGALPQSPPYPRGRVGRWTDTGGRAGGFPGRGRLWGDPPATNGTGRRLGVCVP